MVLLLGVLGAKSGSQLPNLRLTGAHMIGPDIGAWSLDKDRNDQCTTAKLVDAGFLVSDKFHGKNMFDFLF